MKKLFMVSLMAFLTSAVLAQDVELPEEGTGLESGNLLIEITSSPFGRDQVSNFSESYDLTLLNFGQFRARYALSDAIVPRLGIWFSVDDNKSGLSSPDEVITVTEMMFTPGVEYHFINEEGFTSYAALDVIVSSRSIMLEGPDGNVSGLSSVPSSNNVSAGLGSRGYFGLGAYGAVGADYHLSSQFYIGAEIGFQFMTGTTADVEVDGTIVQNGFKFFDAGVNTVNSFRIGFKLLK